MADQRGDDQVDAAPIASGTPDATVLAGTFGNASELSIWIGNLAVAGPSWAIVERVPSAWLTARERSQGIRLIAYPCDLDLSRYERGVLFGQDFELRWQQGDRAITARYVGTALEQPEPLSAIDDAWTEPVDVRDQPNTMWGELVQGSERDGIGRFATARLPSSHFFPMPASGVPRIALLTRVFRSARTGEVLLWRFAGLTTANRPGGSG